MTRSITKSVSFDYQVRVRKALHINDFSEQEIQATWLSRDDLMRIRQEIDFTVDLIEKGADIDEETYSRRGLEFRTRLGAHMRLENKECARDAVLSEQEFQKDEGYSDDEELATVYSETSYRCQVAAHMLALADLKTVRDLARSHNEKCDDTVYKKEDSRMCYARPVPRSLPILRRAFGSVA